MIEFPLWAMVVICIFAVIGGITALVILYFLVIYPIVDMIRNYSDYKKFYYRYNYRTDDLEMLDILKRNLKNKSLELGIEDIVICCENEEDYQKIKEWLE